MGSLESSLSDSNLQPRLKTTGLTISSQRVNSASTFFILLNLYKHFLGGGKGGVVSIISLSVRK